MKHTKNMTVRTHTQTEIVCLITGKKLVEINTVVSTVKAHSHWMKQHTVPRGTAK